MISKVTTYLAAYRSMLAYCTVVIGLSYGPELVDFTFSTDYFFHQVLSDFPGPFGNDGRWLSAWIYFFVFNGQLNPFIFKILFFSFQLITTIILCENFNITRNAQRTLIFSIMCIHPYLLSLHSFNEILPFYGLGNLLSVVAVNALLARSNGKGLVLASTLLAAALAIWPIGLNYGLLFFIFSLIQMVLRDQRTDWSYSLRMIALLVAAHLFGSLLYFAIAFLHTKAGLIQPARMQGLGQILENSEQIIEKIRFAISVIRQYLFRAQDYFPWLAKLLLDISIVSLLNAAWKRLSDSNTRLTDYAWIVTLTLVALLACIGVTLPLNYFGSGYRLLYGFGMFNALIFALIFGTIGGKSSLVAFNMTIAGIVAMVFIYQASFAHHQMSLKNRYEWSIGFAIAKEIEALPQFRQHMPLAIYGTKSAYFRAPFSTGSGCDDEKYPVSFLPREILREQWSADRFLYPFFYFQQATEQQRQQLAGFVADMPSWPRPGAVTIHDHIIVVKFND